MLRWFALGKSEAENFGIPFPARVREASCVGKDGDDYGVISSSIFCWRVFASAAGSACRNFECDRRRSRLIARMGRRVSSGAPLRLRSGCASTLQIGRAFGDRGAHWVTTWGIFGLRMLRAAGCTAGAVVDYSISRCARWARALISRDRDVP